MCKHFLLHTPTHSEILRCCFALRILNYQTAWNKGTISVQNSNTRLARYSCNHSIETCTFVSLWHYWRRVPGLVRSYALTLAGQNKDTVLRTAKTLVWRIMDFRTYPISELIYTARGGELNQNHGCFRSGQSHSPHFQLGRMPATCYSLFVFPAHVFLPLGQSDNDFRAIIGV